MILRTSLAAVILCAVSSAATAQTRTWDANGAIPPNGVFGVNNNWNPNLVPIAGNAALFNIDDTYTVSFLANHASDALDVTAGTVSLRSASAVVRDYDVGFVGLIVRNGSTLHIGADYTSPAYAVILINSNPIFANRIAHFVVPEDRLSGLRVLGLACAFLGVMIVSMGRPDVAVARDAVTGNLAVLISALLVAARLVYTQQLVQRIEPTKLVFWQMVLALPGFAAAAWFADGGLRDGVSWQAVAGVVYQGIVVSGLTFMAWAILLQKHSPGSLSVFSFTVPIFGVLLSGWLFQEALTARLILGVLAVTGGIALATQAGRRAVYDADPDTNEP